MRFYGQEKRLGAITQGWSTIPRSTTLNWWLLLGYSEVISFGLFLRHFSIKQAKRSVITPFIRRILRRCILRINFTNDFRQIQFNQSKFLCNLNFFLEIPLLTITNKSVITAHSEKEFHLVRFSAGYFLKDG